MGEDTVDVKGQSACAEVYVCPLEGSLRAIVAPQVEEHLWQRILVNRVEGGERGFAVVARPTRVQEDSRRDHRCERLDASLMATPTLKSNEIERRGQLPLYFNCPL